MQKIIEKIESCRTITQFNNIRSDVFDAMTQAESDAERLKIQKAFRRQKNRIRAKVYGREEYPWNHE